MRAGGGRAKGAAFEREICKLIEQETSRKLRRRLSQYQEKNLSDLEPADNKPFPFLIECKRYAKLSPSNDWYDQIVAAARSAANTNDALPCLIYKLDRQQTQVRIPIEALVMLGRPVAAKDIAEAYDWRYTATLDWDTFAMVLREHLADVD
jgi:Holliday junction resolvase